MTSPSTNRAAQKTKNGPRALNYHELKPALIDRFGTPRLNIRSGGVLLGTKEATADQVDRLYLELSNENEQWPIKPTADAIWAMAEANPMDPVADFLLEVEQNSRPLPPAQWKRLDKWLLGIDNPTAAQFLQQYFVGAVARVFAPGCEARCSPVLIGPQQRGKTTLGRILFGEPFWVEGLKNLERDAVMRCQTGWGVELSELDGVTRRCDVESLKTFLTERVDSFRKPYGRGVVKTDRRFVFWGTANGPPLRDLSGNSRFLCIGLPDQMLPLDWAIANRKALWAMAVKQYRKGFDWVMVSEEERGERIAANLNFEQIDPWAELIAAALRHSGSSFVPISTLYEKLEVPPERQNNVNARRIRELAAREQWEYRQRRVNGVAMRGFWRPGSC